MAAKAFFAKLDAGDLRGAYQKLSTSTRSVTSFESWKASLRLDDRVVSRNYPKNVVYELPEGVKIAVEFNGITEAKDRECGYLVVEAAGYVVRFDSTRVPAKALASGGSSSFAQLMALPGCDSLGNSN